MVKLVASVGSPASTPALRESAMFATTVRRVFQNSRTRPVLVQSEKALNIPALKRAVVVLHATWSGPSTACLSCLAAAKLVPTGEWLYVVDIDAVNPSWTEKHVGCVSHGRGETFWVRDGAVTHRDENYALRQGDVADATTSLFGL